MVETLYYDRNGGADRYDAWAYSDGQRIYVLRGKSEAEVLAYAKKYCFRPLFVPPNPERARRETPASIRVSGGRFFI